mmetsp:Transcript_4798/g.9029  ORF Transcript_4798/g.9029 Transcript_4798/m.9029 type:complete len:400 (-) Transcript_4798:716-1915(-)
MCSLDRWSVQHWLALEQLGHGEQLRKNYVSNISKPISNVIHLMDTPLPQRSSPARRRREVRVTQTRATSAPATHHAHNNDHVHVSLPTKRRLACDQCPSKQTPPPMGRLEVQRAIWLIGSHPEFKRVVQLYGNIHMRLDGHITSMPPDMEATMSLMQGCMEPCPELDEFMVLFRQALERHWVDRVQLQSEAQIELDNLNSWLERLLQDERVSQSVDDSPGASAVVLDATPNAEPPETQMSASHASNDSSTSLVIALEDATDKHAPLLFEDDCRETVIARLKENYTISSLRALQSKFRRQVPKEKLPIQAKQVLMVWWRQNVLWPYPTEEQMIAMHAYTGLKTTQIEDWFSNQRRRHWRKHFPDGPPKSILAALNVLRTIYGSLEQAQTSMISNCRMENT